METDKTLRQRAAYARKKIEELYESKGYSCMDGIRIWCILEGVEKIVYRALHLGYELGMDDAKKVLRKQRNEMLVTINKDLMHIPTPEEMDEQAERSRKFYAKTFEEMQKELKL